MKLYFQGLLIVEFAVLDTNETGIVINKLYCVSVIFHRSCRSHQVSIFESLIKSVVVDIIS